MRGSLLLVFATIIFIGCGRNKIIDGKRQGRWIEKDTLNGQLYLAKGRYKDDFQCGTWKYRAGRQLVKKEKYKGADCHTWFYHKNGKVMREGFTKLIINDSILHWYYTGDWIEFDTLGKPIEIDTYKLGELQSEKILD